MPLLIIMRTVFAAAGTPDIAGFLFEDGTLTHVGEELGDMGLAHQHMQFGTGTFNPVVAIGQVEDQPGAVGDGLDELLTLGVGHYDVHIGHVRAVLQEELDYVQLPSLSVELAIGQVIAHHGSDVLKREFLPRIIAGQLNARPFDHLRGVRVELVQIGFA